MNKCEKCGGIHWRTAPCVPSKKSTAPSESETSRSRSANESLPVDTSRVRKKALVGEMPSVNEQPETEGKLVQVQQSHSANKFDKKAWMKPYMAIYMAKYRADIKAGLRKPKSRPKK